MKTFQLFLASKKRIAVLFLGGFVAIGCVLTFAIPPFQVPDENTHWNTALKQIGALTGSESYFETWRTLPASFDVDRIKHAFDQKLRPGTFSQLALANAAETPQSTLSYSNFLSYPQVILAALIEIGLHSDNPRTQALHGFYLARLLSGIMILIPLIRLVQLASASNPPGLLPILACALCPLFIQQSFAVSSDTVCNAFVLWTLALLHMEKPSFLDWTFIGIYGLLACSTKPMIVFIAIAVGVAYWIEHRDTDPSQRSALPGKVRFALFILTA
jgi:hypothetical protein